MPQDQIDSEEFDGLEEELNQALDQSDDEAFPVESPREYVREGRRFVPKEQDSEPQNVAKEWAPLWLKPDHGVEWAKLPEGFRKALQEREREAAMGIEQHSTRAKVWEPVERQLAPHTDELRQAGLSGAQYVSNLIEADKFLRADPEAGVAWIAEQMGVDLIALADRLADAPRIDPRVRELEQQVQRLSGALNQFQTGMSQQQRDAEVAKIREWAKDKPYFDEVRERMAALARVNQGATLDQLYDEAVYAHPQLRQRVLDDQRHAAASRARRAAVSQRGAPSGPVAPRKLSLEEEIGALYDGA